MVGAEGRILLQSVLSLQCSRRQLITVYKIDLIFFIHAYSLPPQRKNPVSGSDALPPLASTLPIPVRYAFLPASIASLKAAAISGTSPAVAIAVFAIIAAAPISIASHAWDGFADSGIHNDRQIDLIDQHLDHCLCCESLVASNRSC